MEEVTVHGKVHKVYTEDEAVEREIKFKEEWSEGQEGDWVKTDDGFVLQILKTGQLGKRHRWLRTAIGTYPSHGRCDCEERESRYTLGGHRNTPVRLTKRLRVFCRLWAMSGDAIESYKHAFPNANDENYIEARVNQVTRAECVQNEMYKHLREVAARVGVDEEYVMTRFKELAEDGEKDADKLRALENLAKMLKIDGGINRKLRVSRTVTEDSGFSREELSDLEKRSRVRVTAEEEVSK
jgi:hypothetical protein